MKKIFLLVISILFVLQVTAFAQPSKDVTSNSVTIQSTYLTNYNVETNGKTEVCNFIVTAMTTRFIDITTAEEYRYLILSAISNTHSDNLIVFSRKNPPIIEIEKNGQSLNIIPKKISNIGSDTFEYQLKKEELKEVYNADKVSIVLPTNKNSTIKFEIPKSDVADWETVYTSDMKQLRRDLMNR